MGEGGGCMFKSGSKKGRRRGVTPSPQTFHAKKETMVQESSKEGTSRKVNPRTGHSKKKTGGRVNDPSNQRETKANLGGGKQEERRSEAWDRP